MRYTAIKIFAIILLVVVGVSVTAAPVPKTAPKLIAKSPVGKWTMMWLQGLDDLVCPGPAVFYENGTYTQLTGGFHYMGTWKMKGDQLHVYEHEAGSTDIIEWWVDLNTGIGERSTGDRIEIWLKPTREK